MTHRLIKNGELVLYGPVGMVDLFSGEGFGSVEVLEALAELDDDITVRLNSGGGFAYDGIAVSNALKAYDGKVTTIVDGIAASAASIIAMAGIERIMADGAVLMVHNASGLTIGTAADHVKGAETLGKLDGELARIYAKATGKRPDAMRKLMDAETWMNADEAIKQGFATGKVGATASDPTAFDYRAYANAPERLVAMANAKGWPRLSNIRSFGAPRLAPAEPAPANSEAEALRAKMLAKWDRWLSSHPQAARQLVDAHELGAEKRHAVFSELWDQAQAGEEVIADHAGGTAVEAINAAAAEIYSRRFAARDRKLH